MIRRMDGREQKDIIRFALVAVLRLFFYKPKIIHGQVLDISHRTDTKKAKKRAKKKAFS